MRKRMPSEDRRGGPETALISGNGLPAGPGEGDHVASLLPLARRARLRAFPLTAAVVAARVLPGLLRTPAERFEDLGHRVLDDLVDPREGFHHTFELLERGCLAVKRLEVARQDFTGFWGSTHGRGGK